MFSVVPSAIISSGRTGLLDQYALEVIASIHLVLGLKSNEARTAIKPATNLIINIVC